MVTIDENVARWAATPIPLGHPGFCLTALVLGPNEIPRILDVAQAQQTPELAVLGVMAHGKDEEPERAVEMAKAALIACHDLPDDRALPYSELVLLSLNQAAKIILEKLMASGQFEYQSDFARKHRGEGEAIGVAKGEARAILSVLEARKVHVPDEVRQRILACTDHTVLERWIRRAVTLASTDELFCDT
ncbi:hypothetical protein LZC94_40210 [Pendulispora albinea]|uniref:Uncharacterized protein n=1 Tax=Pendulispora albinea TaxID=2741071 RepID=A0ABZ2MCQ2_9BACT